MMLLGQKGRVRRCNPLHELLVLFRHRLLPSEVIHDGRWDRYHSLGGAVAGQAEV
jgi:hypothetical protein